MSKEFVDGAGAFGRIRSFIRKKYGTQRKCARALGISEGHLSDMLNSRCEISPILLAAAGLVRRVVYEVRELPEMKADDCRKGGDAPTPSPCRPVSVPVLPRPTFMNSRPHPYRIGLTAEATVLGLNRQGILLRPPAAHSGPSSGRDRGCSL